MTASPSDAPEYLEVALGELVPHPANIRRVVAVDTLALNMKAVGLLEPLLTAPYADDPSKVVVLAGHRRLAAAQKIGLSPLPCFHHETLTDPADQIAVMLSENGEREQLTAAEEAAGVQAMLDLGESVSSIAKRVGMSRTRVKQRAKIGALDAKILDKVHTHDVTIADAVFIADHPDHSARLEKALGTNNWAKEREAVTREVAREKEAAAQVKTAKETLGAVELPASKIGDHAREQFGSGTDDPVGVTLKYLHGSWDEQVEAARAALRDDDKRLVYVTHDWDGTTRLVTVELRTEPPADDSTDSEAPADDNAATDDAPSIDTSAVDAARRAAAELAEERAAATDARRRFIRGLTDEQAAAAAATGSGLMANLIEEVGEEGGTWLHLDARLFLDPARFDVSDPHWPEIDDAMRRWVATAPPAMLGAALVISTLMSECDRYLEQDPTEHSLLSMAMSVASYIDWLRNIGHVLSDVEENIAAEYAQAARLIADE
ncbi:ParB/RepB/Spo0J family partition protein [Gordonia malaquae]|uniref:ParB/RepB/Spo0J family partition protein n=1 Tax=Gordonia malaquae TaxID=410332 RepID=UPI0030C78DD0